MLQAVQKLVPDLTAFSHSAYSSPSTLFSVNYQKSEVICVDKDTMDAVWYTVLFCFFVFIIIKFYCFFAYFSITCLSVVIRYIRINPENNLHWCNE